jgi:cytochrome P450
MSPLPTLDDVTVADLEHDPYPIYARLRRDAAVAFLPAVDVWLVTRWADVEAASKQPDRFPAAVPGGTLDLALGGVNVLSVDGERHSELRAPLRPSMRAREVDATLPATVKRLCAELLDQLRPLGAADLMADYFEPVSVLALAHTLGLAEEVDVATLRAWFAGLAAGTSNYERDPAKNALARRTSADIDAVVRPVLERLDSRPGADMLSALLHARPGSFEERTSWMLPTFKLVLIGGLQEPGHGGGTVVHGLLSDRSQLDAVLRRPDELVPAAVHEGLRWVAPIGNLLRAAAEGAEVAGIPLPAGARVVLNVASANRDEREWGAGADRFEIARPRRGSGAFGFGTHACIGVHFARVLLHVAVRALLDELPNLRLDGGEVVYHGWEYRSPVSLGVAWDA